VITRLARAFASAEGCCRIFRIVPDPAAGDARLVSKRQGPIMATSEAVLTVIAIRLAALVVAGLVVRIAATDHPHQEAACTPEQAVVDVQASSTSKAADDMMGDMRLHD
jgi:hypothetical protein